MKTRKVSMTTTQHATWLALEAEQQQLQQRLSGFVLGIAGSASLEPPFGNPRVEVKDGVISMLLDVPEEEKKEEQPKPKLKRA